MATGAGSIRVGESFTTPSINIPLVSCCLNPSSPPKQNNHPTLVQALHLLSLGQHVGHLWRQHHGTPIIPPIKVDQHRRRLLWEVLVDKVPSFGKHLERVFACRPSSLAHTHLPPGTASHKPCICPIVNSVSNRSVPASNNNLPPLAAKNLRLSPVNHPSQNGCVAAKSVLHRHANFPPSSSPSSASTNNPGTLTLALLTPLTVLLLTCHSTPSLTLPNPLGRVANTALIPASASTALPSTTSNTAYPSTFPPNPPWNAKSVTTAPPRLCPTSTTGGSSVHPIAFCTSSTTAHRSEDNVDRERSMAPVVSPWPRASGERIPAPGRRLRISEARIAKERPQEPAPWWVMKSGEPPPGDGEVR